MAGIVFKCPNCDNSVASDDTLCGDIAQCPECHKDIIVPIPGVQKDNVYGDFKLLERLGTGASGEVWLAYQQSMDRKVALKILCPKLSSDPNFINRFMKEAKNSAKLSHPNIVTAFSAGQDKGMYYLAISYVNGETIESKLERDHLYDEKEALLIIKSIAVALQYAWDEYKILHRDIKPANIIVNKKSVPMLLDLGISKSIQDEDSSLTMTGTVVGTPYYMSPEQAIADKDLDFRSDLYSLGVTLYHMVSGTVPFQATTAMAIIMKHLNDNFESPQHFNPNLSNNCCSLLEIMMAKKKEDRQQSWTALINDIDAVLAGNGPLSAIPAEGTSTLSRNVTSGPIVQSQHKSSGSNLFSKNKKFILPIVVFLLLILIFFLFNSKGNKSKDRTTINKISNKTTIKNANSAPKENLLNKKQHIVEDMWGSKKSTPTIIKNDLPKKQKIIEPIKKPIPKKVEKKSPPIIEKQSTVIVKTKSTPVVNKKVPPSSPSISKVTSTKIERKAKPKEKFDSSPIINDDFIQIANKLDYSKHTGVAVKDNWKSISGKEFTWSGKVINVKGGWFKSEVTIAAPGRMLYKGFNILLVTKEKEKAVKLQKGSIIKFTGNVYKYKPRRSGLVILYMHNVKFID